MSDLNKTTGGVVNNYTIKSDQVSNVYDVLTAETAYGNIGLAKFSYLNAGGTFGRVNLIPDVSADRVVTLPTPAAGVTIKLLGPTGLAAADGHDIQLKTGSDNSIFFKGQVLHVDTDQTGQTVAPVFSDQDSNSLFNILLPSYVDILLTGVSTTVWQISGIVASADAPTFADQ